MLVILEAINFIVIHLPPSKTFVRQSSFITIGMTVFAIWKNLSKSYSSLELPIPEALDLIATHLRLSSSVRFVGQSN